MKKEAKREDFKDLKKGDNVKFTLKDETGSSFYVKAKVAENNDGKLKLEKHKILNKPKSFKVDLEGIEDLENNSKVKDLSKDKYPYQKFDFKELALTGTAGQLIKNFSNKDKKQLLDGQPTDLQLKSDLSKELGAKNDFKLSLYRNKETGEMKIKLNNKLPKLEIADEIRGIKFTDEMKTQLKEFGHLGKVDGFISSKSNRYDAYVSVDPELNRLEFTSAKAIIVPKVLKGKTLTEIEAKSLKEGKPTLIKDMTARNNEKFSAVVVLDATKKSFKFYKDDNAVALKYASKESLSQKESKKEDSKVNQSTKIDKTKTTKKDIKSSTGEGKTSKTKKVTEDKGVKTTKTKSKGPKL